MIFSLYFLNCGALGSVKSTSQLYHQGPPSSCQTFAIHELDNAVAFFLCPAAQKNEWRRLAMVGESTDRERVLLPAEDWSEYLKSRRLSCSGEVSSRAETVTWAQVEPALPPPGLGGKVSALALAPGLMRDLLMKAELTCVSGF